MKLYQSFNQEVKTPFTVKGGKIRYKREYLKRRREINLQNELEEAINFGGIENNLRLTQKLLLARYSEDEKSSILEILNYSYDSDNYPYRYKSPFEYNGQWIDVWEYELED